MKKVTYSSIACVLLLGLSAQFMPIHARGGDAVAGALGGLAIGTMIGGATSGNSRSSRAEREAERAHDKADRQQERVERLEREIDRRELEQRIGSGNSMVTILVALVVVLLLAVIGLGVFIMRRKF